MDVPPLALYIHWPFCLKKCPYCDFNSHLLRPGDDPKRFSDTLRRELSLAAATLGQRRLTSIFFGGGTPSLLSPQEIAALIEDAKSYFPPRDTIEITLEANPTSLEVDQLPDFKEAGINRLSLGVQSFDDQALSFLGRQHSAAQAKYALKKAYENFSRVNFDLIYARPGQTQQTWVDELNEALAFGPTHLSAYQLTIEPDTNFATLYAKKAFTLPDAEEAADLYRLTEEKLSHAGLKAYEISNYATPSKRSQHNLTYWHYDDYLGIGAGAHSRFQLAGHRYGQENIKSPGTWRHSIQAHQHAITKRTAISPSEAALEMFLMGLRLSEGIDMAYFYQRTGRKLDDILDTGHLQDAIEAGYLIKTTTHLKPTLEGRLRLEALLCHILK